MRINNAYIIREWTNIEIRMTYLIKSSFQKRRYNYSCPSKSNCYPQSATLRPGRYIFELFGASGGEANYDGDIASGGKGGYSSIIYETKSITTLYLYIGGEGSYSTTDSLGGWNGGGSSTGYGSSGGGATDIRSKNCTWYEEDCLNDRIVVAAGGGGAYGGMQCRIEGSDGGGEVGGQMGKRGSACSSFELHKPCIAMQDGCINGDKKATDGKFGMAGNCTGIYCSGGGGGYYGGGSGLRSSSGGSSFVPIDAISAFTKPGINIGNGYVTISILSQFACTKNHQYSINTLILFIMLLYNSK